MNNQLDAPAQGAYGPDPKGLAYHIAPIQVLKGRRIAAVLTLPTGKKWRSIPLSKKTVAWFENEYMNGVAL